MTLGPIQPVGTLEGRGQDLETQQAPQGLVHGGNTYSATSDRSKSVSTKVVFFKISTSKTFDIVLPHFDSTSCFENKIVCCWSRDG